MRILIADDHPLIHRGMSYLIRENFSDTFIGSVFEVDKLFEQLSNKKFEILVLDINMPGFSFVAFEKMIGNHPSLKVLLYSHRPESQFALRYLKAGAMGYVEKRKPEEELVKALQQLYHGHKYFSAEIMDLMTDQLKGRQGISPFEKLSNREFDVATLLLKGYSFNDISSLLHISPSTVSTYKLRIFDKINVKNQMDMLEVARIYDIR